MEFTKLQAAGNDFVLVHSAAKQSDWSDLARQMCDRHFGIGADGLIVVESPGPGSFSMQIYNADGSEAEICGNGLRCFAKFVLDSNLAQGNSVTVHTLAGNKTIEVDRRDGCVNHARVNMGRPEFAPENIPVVFPTNDNTSCRCGTHGLIDCVLAIDDTDITATIVSMGNPHAVAFTQDSVGNFTLLRIGSQVENNHIFPKRTNFEIAQVLNGSEIEARVWERGVGETLACGSGACAVAVVAQKKGYVGNKVYIKLPGGILTVDWDGRGDVCLSGPVEVVFTGKWKKERELLR
jgi:diaminopimelate epimerase